MLFIGKSSMIICLVGSTIFSRHWKKSNIKEIHKIFLIILEALKSKANQIEDYYLTCQVFELKLLNRTNFHHKFILINVGLKYFYQHTDLSFAELLWKFIS